MVPGQSLRAKLESEGLVFIKWVFGLEAWNGWDEGSSGSIVLLRLMHRVGVRNGIMGQES